MQKELLTINETSDELIENAKITKAILATYIITNILLIILLIIFCCKASDIHTELQHYIYHTYGCCNFYR